MKNKALIIGLVVVVIIGGIIAATASNNNSKRLAAEQAEKQAMMKQEENASMMAKEDETMMKDENNMMDDNQILGVVMIDGTVMTLWEGNEVAALTHDITLKNGTSVSKEGKIMSTTGSEIVLKNGEELMTDGTIVMVDLATLMMEEKKTMNDKDSSMKEDTMMKESASTYVDYSSEVLASAEMAQKSGRKVVLFFHANWCPFCRAADKDFKATIGTDAFPKNVTLIKTDYDSQTELKQKYGVNYQHTFVQIDSNGNQITKWVSGETSELSVKIQ